MTATGASLSHSVVRSFQDETCNPHDFRANVQQKLREAFEGEASRRSSSRALNLERAIFNAAVEKCDEWSTLKSWTNRMFVDAYLRILHSTLHYLRFPHIQAGIEDGSIRTHRIPTMTHQEVNPERWSALLEKKDQREQSMFRSNVIASTDSYTCRRCKSKECTFYQMQTRSADEPMTIFITCISCGKHWKQ